MLMYCPVDASEMDLLVFVMEVIGDGSHHMLDDFCVDIGLLFCE